MRIPSENTSAISRRDFHLALAAMVAILFTLHLNGLRTAHTEGDELVFTFLVLRLAESPAEYHVRGALRGEPADRYLNIAKPHLPPPDHAHAEASLVTGEPRFDGDDGYRYDPFLYDRPWFFHPPAYPYLLAVAHRIFGIERGVLLSATFHCMSVILIAILGALWINRTVGLLAAGILAIEAVSFLCAERIWIDAMLQATVVGAVLAAVWSNRAGGVRRYAIAGGVLALAGLTKLSAGAIAPAILIIWLLSDRRPVTRETVAYCLAAGAPVLLWMTLSHFKGGQFMPLNAPTEWMIERSQYIAGIVKRPPAYYVFGLIFASPILLYSIGGIIKSATESRLRPALVCGLTWWLTMLALGLYGMGFQLRYLAPAIPFLCILAAYGLARSPVWLKVAAFPLALFTLHVGMTTAMTPNAVDPIRPHAIFMFLGDLTGYRFWSWFEWMW